MDVGGLSTPAGRPGVLLMDRENQAFTDPSSQTGTRQGHTTYQWTLAGFAMLACLGCLALMVAKFTQGDNDGYAQERTGAVQTGDLLTKLKLFQNWEQPALAIVLSGEQHGFLQPCGCTSPQYGGFSRRFNLFQALWQRGWPTAAVDLGDMADDDNHRGPQTLLKYRYSLLALQKMHYGAISFGLLETKVPLFDAMGETVNHPPKQPFAKVLSANLDRKVKGPEYAATIFDSEVIKPVAKQQAPLVGVVGLGGKELEKNVKDGTVTFDKDTPKILEKSLLDCKKQGAELFIVLYVGNVKDAKEMAKWWSGQRKNQPDLPNIDVILCQDGDLPPVVPEFVVGETIGISVGHKGQHVGVVGAYRTGNARQPFQLKYQLVQLVPEFATPEGQEKGNLLNQLMEEYARDVKANDMLGKVKQKEHETQVALKAQFPKVQVEYVGSAACAACHPNAVKIWKKGIGPKNLSHSIAYTTLQQAKNPSLRQYDPECVKCHVVGLGYKTGFENENQPPPNIADLRGVGCESCHGPCSMHVAKPREAAFYPHIDKFKYRGQGPEKVADRQQRILAIDKFCQSCHDLENDNSFDFNKKWPLIEHMNTPAQAAVRPGPQLNAQPGPQIVPPKQD
jgi:2',3'-cyclic-nucleotide 2'-phosphodiesterase (5'-nucleotidase family)